MCRQVNATDAKATILSMLDDVAAGEEIEITRYGRTVARLVPAREARALKGLFAGVAATARGEHELFSAGTPWRRTKPQRGELDV
ncbi:MAG TPA: type II toxin-antitoxin system prevent-host-death family antitoxin [Solirubrobacteraceae bacterium]|nr:type II toxin-antitoxin system prevent-host-death family antitoxin [Solirubrobacteraceae bacterium]